MGLGLNDIPLFYRQEDIGIIWVDGKNEWKNYQL
jgi:hypothetical protein